MPEWRPGWFARMFRGAGSWNLRIDDFRLRVADIDPPVDSDVADVAWFDADDSSKTISFALNTGQETVLNGLPRRAVHEVGTAFAFQMEEWRRVKQLLSAAIVQGRDAANWWGQVTQVFESPRWVDQASAEELDASRPDTSAWSEVEQDPRLAQHLGGRPESERNAVQICRTASFKDLVEQRNESFIERESRALADFFGTVEKSPLTPEQIKATICFDNRVRVIASAGSGKTSTIVARAGYAILRSIVQPTEILALAFNSKAAAELSERFEARLGDAGATATSSTFHAFGLRVIGEATGRKPSTPDDLVHDNGVRRMATIVDSLRDGDDSFRRDWDLFRLVFGRPLADLGDDVEIEKSDRRTGRDGFGTLAGEVVRSQEEVMIANWLFINGVEYEYERRYQHDVADPRHRQYQPDFYYPAIDTWHEHWAVGPDGSPPPQFHGYGESMAWRRETHRRFGTRLIETTSATIREGSGFDHLESELRRLGVELDENPYREVVGEAPIDDKKLIDLMRSFLVHVKGNRLTGDQLSRRIGNGLRERLFLRLFGAVAAEWDRQLRSEGCIDFEDMLNLATDHIAAGRWTSPFRLVMVDEMQDTSASRAALVRALIRGSGNYLYAVGDDWQSINRFAGSDLGVMTRFDDWFGKLSTVMLSRTFRSPQSLCDVAGSFVMKNPAQISKLVTSTAQDNGETVFAVGVRKRTDYDSVLGRHLAMLDAECDELATVLVLGRYKRSKDDVAGALKQKRANVSVEYSTVHASKGKEADFVVVLGLERGRFPSTIVEDPLLQVAMVARDPHPFAEERRLFYVALTRARRSVMLLTTVGLESPFLVELAAAGALKIKSASGDDIESVICPQCRKRTMKIKDGKYGRFYSCTGYPQCKGSMNIS